MVDYFGRRKCGSAAKRPKTIQNKHAPRAPPLEFGFGVPQTDAHGGSQLDVVFTQIVPLIVRQVAPQSNAREYQQVPVIHAFASTVCAGIAVHILTDQIKHFLCQCPVGIHVLQRSQDRNDAVTTVEIQLHLMMGTLSSRLCFE
jgi:hypothetical protein